MDNRSCFRAFVILCILSMIEMEELDVTAPWPTLRGDQGRTGRSEFVLQVDAKPTQQWFRSYDKGEGQWSTNVAVDKQGRVFVCAFAGDRTYEFVAFNSTGKKLWTYSYKTEFYNPGVCGNAIVGTNSSIFWNVPAEAMFSFDSETGNIKWKQIGEHLIFDVAPLVSDNVIYGFSYAPIQTNQHLIGLDTSNGNLAFNSSQISPIGAVISMSDDETLYLSGCGFVLATTLSGSHFFETFIPYGCFSQQAINSTTKTAFGLGSFVRTDFGTKVYAFAIDGTIMWQYKLSERTTVDGTSVALNNGVIYATAPNVIVALDQQSGTVLWRTDIPGVETDLSSPVIDASGQVFTIAGNSITQQISLWGFDSETGTKFYASSSVGCSILDIGSAFAITSETSFVVVCRNAVIYFAAPQ